MLSMISIIISSVSTIIIGISAILLWKQIKGNHDWNRRKASHEALNTLTIGEFSDLRHKLEVEFGCAIWDKSQSYEDTVESVSKEEIDEIDAVLRKILNILEATAINMKNSIIDEDICYDYLGLIMTGYYRWSEPFIIERRKRVSGDPRVLGNFEDYAQKWIKRMDKNREE